MTQFNPDSVQIPSTVPAYLAGTIRTMVTFLGGYVVAKGYLSGEQAATVAGVLVPAAMWLWSMIQKHNAGKALKAAIIAPAGAAK